MIGLVLVGAKVQDVHDDGEENKLQICCQTKCTMFTKMPQSTNVAGITAVLTLSTISLQSRTELPKVLKGGCFLCTFKNYFNIACQYFAAGAICDGPRLVHHLQFLLLHGHSA